MKPVDDPIKVDYENRCNQLDDNDMFIGWNTKQTIVYEELQGQVCLRTFTMKVRAFYIKSCKEII